MSALRMGCVIALTASAMAGATQAGEFSVGFDSFGDSKVTGGSVIVNYYLLVPADTAPPSVNAGTVVVPDPIGCVTFFCVKKATASDAKKVVGVVQQGGGGGTSDALVAVAGMFQVEVSGTVNAGDFLTVSNTADGKAMAASSGQDVFGIAIEGATDGVTWAWFTRVDTY